MSANIWIFLCCIAKYTIRTPPLKCNTASLISSSFHAKEERNTANGNERGRFRQRQKFRTYSSSFLVEMRNFSTWKPASQCVSWRTRKSATMSAEISSETRSPTWRGNFSQVSSRERRVDLLCFLVRKIAQFREERSIDQIRTVKWNRNQPNNDSWHVWLSI